MDDKDRQILNLLKKDARMSFQQLGDELGISRVVGGKVILPSHGKEFFHATVSRFLHPAVSSFFITR